MARGLTRTQSDRKAVGEIVRSVFTGRTGQAYLDRQQDFGNRLIYHVISMPCAKPRTTDESVTKINAAINRFGDNAPHQDATQRKDAGRHKGAGKRGPV